MYSHGLSLFVGAANIQNNRRSMPGEGRPGGFREFEPSQNKRATSEFYLAWEDDPGLTGDFLWVCGSIKLSATFPPSLKAECFVLPATSASTARRQCMTCYAPPAAWTKSESMTKAWWFHHVSPIWPYADYLNMTDHH